MAESPPDITLTAGASGATRPAADLAAELAPGAQVGRYRLVRLLGAGGMGVVWAAHDPDLDREVALKVLRPGDAAPARRARLLREARAMAKVRHANVITVHEVGTTDGRDFVAMEIVRGRTIAEWLIGRKRTRAEIWRVFQAAGRGLAAAHAVGLVHRDFKPHNVLLDDDGRVVVTDFGLARAAVEPDAAADPARPAERAGAASAARSGPVALDETLDAAVATAQHTPRDGATLDAALTEAGAVLGTPAYMAPEQIDGGNAGPRADQFAFCVALWEALDGQRPFRGANVLELRQAIERGPTGGGALPRRWRQILRRGLAAEPARRWPDMTALLRALERAERRPWIAFAAIGAIAAAGIAYAAWPRAQATPVIAACAHVHDGRAGELINERNLSPTVLAALHRYQAGLYPALESACQRGEAGAALATCLVDQSSLAGAVLGGAQLLVRDGRVAPDIGSLMPAVVDCYAEPPPSFPHGGKDQLGVADVILRARAAAVRLRAGADDVDDLTAEADDVVTRARAGGSCAAIAEAQLARAEAHIARREVRAATDALDEAATTADQCRHDRVRAEAALDQLDLLVQNQLEVDSVKAARAAAEAAIDRAGKDPILTARLALNASTTAWLGDHLDEAIDQGAAALATFEDHGAIGYATDAARYLAAILQVRGKGDDVARATAIAGRVEQLAENALGPGDARTIAMLRVQMMLAWKRGDRAVVAALRARLADHPDPRPPIANTTRVTGTVVDEQGRPIVGATVAAGIVVVGDESALDLTAGGDMHIGTASTATTGAGGAFAIDDVARGAWVIAQAPDGRRSMPMPVAGAPVLRVGPVAKVFGKVELGDRPASAVVVDAVPITMPPSLWSEQAPIAPDGSFVIDHLPRGRWSIRVRDELGLSFGAVATAVDVDRPEVGPVDLRLNLGHAAIDVVVRADRDVVIPLAQITALPGRAAPRSLAEMLAIARSNPAVRNLMLQRAGHTDERVGDIKLERGDLRGTISGLAPGLTTVCAVPLSADTMEPSGLANLYARAGDVDVTCQTITVPDGGPRPALLFVAPPMKRFP